MDIRHVCNRKFFISKPKADPEIIIRYSPGDIIYDFSRWPIENQRTHLAQNLVSVEYVASEEEKAASIQAQNKQEKDAADNESKSKKARK